MPHYTEVQQTAATIREIAQARCVREAAAMLCLGQTGTEFDDDIVEGQWAKVASVAAEFGASPDDMQRVLEMHEPSLAME